MTDYEEVVEQRSVRDATIQYIEALPSAHRQLLQVMAKEYQRPAYALVAGAIERLIVDWTRTAAPDEFSVRKALQRQSA